MTVHQQIGLHSDIRSRMQVERPEASGPNQTGFTAITGDLTVGTNTFTLIASDKCGNEDTTTCTIVVKRLLKSQHHIVMME
jgi:hypothetical protein